MIDLKAISPSGGRLCAESEFDPLASAPYQSIAHSLNAVRNLGPVCEECDDDGKPREISPSSRY